jgi:hypothetical protein
LISLVFQGLANLAKFKPDSPASTSSNRPGHNHNHNSGNASGSGIEWDAAKQLSLPRDLLEMAQDIPKDAQLAALNAISSLLAVPQEGVDVYNLLRKVHETFGRGIWRLDLDFKAPVAAIYGHLGTVERNVSVVVVRLV